MNWMEKGKKNSQKSLKVGKTRSVATDKSSTVKDHSGEVPGVRPDPNFYDSWRDDDAKS